MFAFYAATNDAILKFGGGPVTIFSYESPKVGAVSFQDAFKFLERRDKLRHARFRVKEDKGEFERRYDRCHYRIDL
jgi:hypothetical protein